MSEMSQAPFQPLDYAAPTAINGRPAWFRALTLTIALFCAMFNVSLIVISVSNLQATAEVYPNLVRNPKYYARKISPDVIASLRDTLRLQTAEAALIAAASVGLWLALYLFIAALKFNRNPITAVRNLGRYQRWKVIGACGTAVAFGWSLQELQQFWIAATRHPSMGWPPLFDAAVLFACAMIPVLWVHSGVRSVMPNAR